MKNTLKEAMEALDLYLSAGHKEARQKAAEKAKQVWKDYYGVDYINRLNKKNQPLSKKERGLI